MWANPPLSKANPMLPRAALLSALPGWVAHDDPRRIVCPSLQVAALIDGASGMVRLYETHDRLTAYEPIEDFAVALRPILERHLADLEERAAALRAALGKGAA